MSLGKFTTILTGFSFSPSLARFITSISSTLGLDRSLFLFRAFKMSQGKFETTSNPSTL